MKKSLLLSIVMTLVLVVAMSTATFAWYTSQASVTAQVNTVTAQTAGGTLKVKIGEGVYGTEVSADAGAAIDLCAPTAELTSANVATGIWSKGTQNFAGDASLTLNNTGSYITGTITVTNDGETATKIKSTVAVSATSDTDANNAAADAAEYVVFDSTGAVVLATGYDITESATAKGDPNATVASSYTTTSTVAAHADLVLTYYIWINGWDAGNTASAGSFNVLFTFETAA